MAYYAVLFDRTADEAFATFGLGPDYVKERNARSSPWKPTPPTSANCTPATGCGSLQILDHDAKRVHYIQEMFHADEGWLSCVMEAIVMHVDMRQAVLAVPAGHSRRDRRDGRGPRQTARAAAGRTSHRHPAQGLIRGLNLLLLRGLRP